MAFGDLRRAAARALEPSRDESEDIPLIPESSGLELADEADIADIIGFIDMEDTSRSAYLDFAGPAEGEVLGRAVPLADAEARKLAALEEALEEVPELAVLEEAEFAGEPTPPPEPETPVVFQPEPVIVPLEEMEFELLLGSLDLSSLEQWDRGPAGADEIDATRSDYREEVAAAASAEAAGTPSPAVAAAVPSVPAAKAAPGLEAAPAELEPVEAEPEELEPVEAELVEPEELEPVEAEPIEPIAHEPVAPAAVPPAAVAAAAPGPVGSSPVAPAAEVPETAASPAAEAAPAELPLAESATAEESGEQAAELGASLGAFRAYSPPSRARGPFMGAPVEGELPVVEEAEEGEAEGELLESPDFDFPATEDEDEVPADPQGGPIVYRDGLYQLDAGYGTSLGGLDPSLRDLVDSVLGDGGQDESRRDPPSP